MHKPALLEQERIANALYQIEAAKRSGYDNSYKRAYAQRGDTGRFDGDINFDAADALPLARPDETQARVARVNPGQTIDDRDIPTRLRTLETPDARRPFIGAVEDPKTGKIETDAGPGRISRFVGKDVGNLPTEQIPAALREKAEADERVKAERALRKAKKPVSEARIARTAKPVDEERLASNTTKAQLTRERAVRDNKKRNAQALAIRTGQAPPAAEPNPTLSGPSGYGADLRQVEDDAREQSSNMGLSDKIREIRRRRMG